MTDYSSLSLWHDCLDEPIEPRPSLQGPTDADVAIVGAGLTGLWTAYYLAKADPHLRIAVVEKHVAGFGASGRNGGWCSSFFAASHDAIKKESGREAAIAMQRAMYDTVDEVGRVVDEHKIDARWYKSGALTLARSAVQLQRLRADYDHECEWGFGDGDVQWLSAEETRQRLNAAGSLGALYTPHCAAVDPARLTRGLATVVEGLGVKIYEQTPALAINPKAVVTPVGELRADVVVRATEGYTATLPQFKRTLMPLYSLMIATEPLPPAFWQEVGWQGHETFGDGRHLIIYAMRTADDRIAIGGRGAPYHFGSRVLDSFDREPAVFAALHEVTRELFPALGAARVTHTWGGPIGVPRDWFSSVGLDKTQGMAWAGGYVGDGVSTTNLAGRTLCDLIVGNDSDITHLAWVGHHSPRWEPEPLRWLAVNALLKVMAGADRAELRTGRPARRTAIVDKLVG